MTGILFDLPHVADNAAKALARRGVSDRVTCVGGDFFESVPASDGYLLSFVLHDWDDASVTRILRNIADGRRPGRASRGDRRRHPPDEQIHMLHATIRQPDHKSPHTAGYSRLTLGLPRHGTCEQMPQFGVPRTSRLSDQVAEHIGGSARGRQTFLQLPSVSGAVANIVPKPQRAIGRIWRQ